MGYTHYWTQKRNFTVAQWQDICGDIRAILDYSQNLAGIPLADGMGEGGTKPEISDDLISFNGLGDDSHETFQIARKRMLESWQTKDRLGWAFCKTAHKPYDDVVTACLAYLATVTRKENPATHEPILGTEALSVSSDGFGSDWLNGLDLARKALPRYANVLDIPMAIMESDRWCAPWISTYPETVFEVHFCVDGNGYVLRPKTGESYCFESHAALAQFLERTKHADFARGGATGWGPYPAHEPNIWNASGSFDKARHARIARAQKQTLATLFPVDMACAQQPPAYVRPGEMPDNAGREFCYSIADLMNLAAKS